jgi:hypothetical protein
MVTSLGIAHERRCWVQGCVLAGGVSVEYCSPEEGDPFIQDDIAAVQNLIAKVQAQPDAFVHPAPLDFGDEHDFFPEEAKFYEWLDGEVPDMKGSMPPLEPHERMDVKEALVEWVLKEFLETRINISSRSVLVRAASREIE